LLLENCAVGLLTITNMPKKIQHPLRKCKYCGNEILPERDMSIYCSDDCKQKAHEDAVYNICVSCNTKKHIYAEGRCKKCYKEHIGTAYVGTNAGQHMARMTEKRLKSNMDAVVARATEAGTIGYTSYEDRSARSLIRRYVKNEDS